MQDYIFTLVGAGGYTAELGRMQPSALMGDVEYNHRLFAASAAKRGLSAVTSRGPWIAVGSEGGMDMGNVVMVD